MFADSCLAQDLDFLLHDLGGVFFRPVRGELP